MGWTKHPSNAPSARAYGAGCRGGTLTTGGVILFAVSVKTSSMTVALRPSNAPPRTPIGFGGGKTSLVTLCTSVSEPSRNHATQYVHDIERRGDRAGLALREDEEPAKDLRVEGDADGPGLHASTPYHQHQSMRGSGAKVKRTPMAFRSLLFEGTETMLPTVTIPAMPSLVSVAVWP